MTTPSLLKAIQSIAKSPNDILSPSGTSDFTSDFTNKKVAVVFCNSYHEKPSLNLGDCAVNDGILSFEEFKRLGFITFLFYDISGSSFLKLFEKFVKSSAETLAVYYIGHGYTTRDASGDEADGHDESLVFNDSAVADDLVGSLISKNNVKKLILIADCCHSGTIFDVPPNISNVITLSACKDSQHAAQDWIDRKGNGVFTHYFWKLIRSKVNLSQLQSKINEKIGVYNQQALICQYNCDASSLFE